MIETQSGATDDIADVRVDTTRGSVLHRWVAFAGDPWTVARVYLACVALAYLPALAVADWRLQADATLRLPFLLDWNFAFAFLVSFPMLVMLIASDDFRLMQALRAVWGSEVISRHLVDSGAFAQAWSRRFARANVLSQALGLAFGAGIAWLTWWVYVRTHAGFWASTSATPGPAGVFYLLSITLLYAVIVVFVTRSVMIALFLSGLVERVTVRLLPFHPDGCGGLRPVGRLGLRNQYTLTVLGLNIAILGVVTVHYLAPQGLERDLIVLAILAYAVLGPIVFMGPLLPFRKAMQRSKDQLMRELSDRLRIDFSDIRARFPGEGIGEADLQTLERLRKVGAMLQELPVWPFDARTLRTFGSAYVVPFVIPILEKAVEAFLALLGVKL